MKMMHSWSLILAFTLAALLLPTEAVAQSKYYYCQYAGLELKAGGQGAMVSNIFLAEDEDTAEDLFQSAADDQHDFYRSSAFCRTAGGDSGRLESERNKEMRRFSELAVHVWDVAVGQPVAPALSEEHKYGEPLYWQCSYGPLDTAHYFSTVAPIPIQPDKDYVTVRSETLAGFGGFLKQKYGVSIGDGGTCTGAPTREETELVQEMSKRGAREGNYNVIQTEWKPMDAPPPQ